MIRSGEVPSGISMRAKWTLTPSGTTRGYHASTTMLTLGTITPRRISALISVPAFLGKAARLPPALSDDLAKRRDHDTIAARCRVATIVRSGGGHARPGCGRSLA